MTSLKRKIQNNIFFLLFSKPGVYLKELIWRTIVIGFVTLSIGLFIRVFHFESATIPASMHSLIGIVIGLLLVFRTNTAYDRWWEGRKIIGSLSQEVSLISIRLGLVGEDVNVINVKNSVNSFLVTLRDYLRNGDTDDLGESAIFHVAQKKAISLGMTHLNNAADKDMNVVSVNVSLGKLLDYSATLERIKNTPIPLSYVLHIKMSILIYLLTLPFGMFHDLGLWSTPLVMLVYYIIAGVEIISNEIENPFADDPNDLPTNMLFGVIIETLWDE